MNHLYFGFNTPEDRRKRRQAMLTDIGKTVTQFFWDDAPNKYHFEEREGQQDMAFEILDALKHDQHIAVEAGVGIGKSFAYSVPLLLYSSKTSAPIIIATSTITLQEQLLSDIERLKKLLHLNNNVILAKGQTHYLCSKRAEDYLLDPNAELRDVIERCKKNGIHDRRDFPCPVPAPVWDKINVTRFSKRGCGRCQSKSRCQYYLLRDELQYTTGIVLCNQDLLTAHLYRIHNKQEGLINTDGGIIVVDEAHNLEDKVRSATTERFGQSYILNTMNAAENEVQGEERSLIQYKLRDCNHSVRALFQNLNRQMQYQIEASKQDMKYADRFFFQDTDNAVALIQKAASDLQSLVQSIQIFGSRYTWKESSSAASDDLESIANSLSGLCADMDKNLIWLERYGSYADLVFCQKNTKGLIQSLYFNSTIRTILTSATLANATQGSMEEQYSYFIQNTGFPLDGTGVLSEPKPSPFPYDEHAMIYYCDDLPHPTREHELFIEQGVARLIQVLEISHGKALVLFTAKTDMEEVYSILKTRELPYKILMQQAGSSQERILQEFKEDTDSVLLGTGAYWEGISIEGKSLSNLVIFRLPFPVPDPIIEYKASISKDDLMEVRVPEMIIKLKQGIGRLIRNDTDTGIVSIIDRRLRDNPPERYHDVTWESLPIHNRTNNLDVLREFYDRIKK
ncbi:MAG: ATP-dependent DNA helicase [Oscillospiraceae bacterium]|nr:ATP-dependent DNA helicase [Oscillospiraceae bacterium]